MSDPLVPRVLSRHRKQTSEEPAPAELDEEIEEKLDRSSVLLESIIDDVRKLDRLREETHGLVENPRAGACPLDVLRRVRSRRAHVVLRDNPPTNIEVIYSDGGVITTADVRRLVEPRLGYLVEVRFRRSLSGQPNTVAWEGMNDRGAIVSGTLVLHAAMRGESEVISWADIEIEGSEERVVVADSDPEIRLRQVANKARALIERIRRGTNVEWRDMIAGLVAIVETVEE